MTMSYLYGDSSPSPLRINFIDFLKDGLEFCVNVLLASQRMREARSQTASLQKDADAHIAQLEKLAALVTLAVEGVSADPDSHTGRCAQAIIKVAADQVRAEITAVRAKLASELSQLDTRVATERTTCAQALQGLLLRHDLPDTTFGMQIQAIGGTRYGARLRSVTPYGVESVIDIDVPPSNVFAHIV